MLSNYEHFINQSKETINSLSDKVHELYNKRNSLYNIISKHKDYLEFVGFPYNHIEQINSTNGRYPYVVDDKYFEDTTEHYMLKANIRAYYVVKTVEIPETIKRIQFYSLCAAMPKRIYRNIMMRINTEVSKHILLGGKYTFTNNIGGIEIARVPRNFDKKVVNWGETNKLKKNGEKGIIYHLDDEYLSAIYYKKDSTADNYKLYRFKFTSFINTKERKQCVYYDSVNTIDDILNESKVGNFEKMMAIKHIKGIEFYSKSKKA